MGDESTSCTVVPWALDDPDHRHHCFPTSCLHRHHPVGLCRRSTLAVHSHHSRPFNATTPGRSLPAAPWIPPLTLGVSVIEWVSVQLELSVHVSLAVVAGLQVHSDVPIHACSAAPLNHLFHLVCSNHAGCLVLVACTSLYMSISSRC